jgi:hypothetical protein
MRRIASLGTGKLAVLATLAVVLGALIVFGQDLFSSGPLSEEGPRQTTRGGVRSHAEITRCSRCHAPLWSSETMTARCLKCHDNVKDQLASNGPLHGRLAAGQECVNCHTEHKGSHAGLTDMTTFDHDCAAFALTGEHQKADCAKCHTGAAYQGAPRTCVSCHAEPVVHQGRFSTDCARCHSPSTWKSDSYDRGAFVSVGFDHDLTGFALRDAHAAIGCNSCHVKESFTGLSPSCVSCHKEPEAHLGKFGVDCGRCHGANNWRAANLHPATLAAVRFDHGATAFPLTGKHVTVECKSCHSSVRFKGTPQTCAACHEEPTSHKPHPRSFGQDCGRCHSTASWQGATLAKHGFPMNHGMRRQGNVNSACKTCHPATTEHVSFTAAKASPSYSTYTCYGCHQHTRAKEAKRRQHQKATDLDKCASCHRFGRGGRREASEGLPSFASWRACPEVAGGLSLTSCPASDSAPPLPASRLGPVSLVGRLAERPVAHRGNSASRTSSTETPGPMVFIDFLRRRW